jgi:hypothetical protein
MPSLKSGDKQKTADLPFYLSKEKNAKRANLLLLSWILIAIVGLAFSLLFPQQCAAFFIYITHTKGDLVRFLEGLLFCTGVVLWALLPIQAYKHHQIIQRINTNTAPAVVYDNEVALKKQHICDVSKKLTSKKDKVFIDKLNSYIDAASKPKFSDFDGNYIGFDEDLYDHYDLKESLQWTGKQLDKVANTDVSKREELENKILSKAATLFEPFIATREMATLYYEKERLALEQRKIYWSRHKDAAQQQEKWRMKVIK